MLVFIKIKLNNNSCSSIKMLIYIKTNSSHPLMGSRWITQIAAIIWVPLQTVFNWTHPLSSHNHHHNSSNTNSNNPLLQFNLLRSHWVVCLVLAVILPNLHPSKRSPSPPNNSRKQQQHPWKKRKRSHRKPRNPVSLTSSNPQGIMMRTLRLTNPRIRTHPADVSNLDWHCWMSSLAQCWMY